MTLLLALNLGLIAFAIALPNDVLAAHSFVLYGLQLLAGGAYIARRAVYVKNMFLPSVFVFFYFAINLTFGGYLVPRYFGFQDGYSRLALSANTYNLIVPYLLAANLILLLIAAHSLRDLRALDADGEGRTAVDPPGIRLAFQVLLVAAFAAVAYVNPYMAFSFLLAILIVHVCDLARRRSPFRFAVYVFYVVALLFTSFHNKRQIAIGLLTILFLESFFRRTKLSFRPGSVVRYGLAGATFFVIVVVASILRAAQVYDVQSPVGALMAVPGYVGSGVFVDAMTANLEIDYHYGSAISSIQYANEGRLPWQFGASLWKVAFLPIPREVFPAKPESVMQLFTETYAPSFAARGGSLPVMFAAEMYVNFALFGLVPFVLVWAALDRLFVLLHGGVREQSFAFYSATFLCMTVFMLARGSGLELWLVYYLFSIPAFALLAGLKRSWPARLGGGVPGLRAET